MKTKSVITPVLILTLALGASALLAHGKSPRGSVSQRVGETLVSVEYGRPGVKGRTLWGELVPFGEVWRTGADKATTITFDTPVKIAGREIAAGKYGLLTLPGEGNWSFILSRNAGLFGTRNYTPDEDVVRVESRPEAAPHCERLLFTFENLGDASADLVLHWGELRVRLTVESAAPAHGDSSGR